MEPFRGKPNTRAALVTGALQGSKGCCDSVSAMSSGQAGYLSRQVFIKACTPGTSSSLVSIPSLTAAPTVSLLQGSAGAFGSALGCHSTGLLLWVLVEREHFSQRFLNLQPFQMFRLL